MNIHFKGPDGVQQRLREIQNKLDALTGTSARRSDPSPQPTPNPPNFEATLQGAIGKHEAASLAPMDPFHAVVQPAHSNPTDLKSIAAATAQKYGIDPNVFLGLVEQESDFNPREVSGKGAAGLTQLMPATAKALGVTDPFDPAQNLEGGAKYFRQMMQQFGGDTKLALAAYNAGPGAVMRAGGVPPFAETQDYVTKVMAKAEALRRK